MGVTSTAISMARRSLMDEGLIAEATSPAARWFHRFRGARGVHHDFVDDDGDGEEEKGPKTPDLLS